MKVRQETVEDRCRPECTLARCLCRLDGPQDLKAGYHGMQVRHSRRQGQIWLQTAEEAEAPLVYFHQDKHIWVGYPNCQSGMWEEGAEANNR